MLLLVQMAVLLRLLLRLLHLHLLLLCVLPCVLLLLPVLLLVACCNSAQQVFGHVDSVLAQRVEPRLVAGPAGQYGASAQHTRAAAAARTSAATVLENSPRSFLIAASVLLHMATAIVHTASKWHWCCCCWQRPDEAALRLRGAFTDFLKHRAMLCGSFGCTGGWLERTAGCC